MGHERAHPKPVRVPYFFGTGLALKSPMFRNFLWALLGVLLIHVECLGVGQCRAVHRPIFDRAKFDVTGVVFEPIWPRGPWGPNNQYHANIRANTALVFQGLRDPENFKKDRNAFHAQLTPYEDTPGSGMMGHFQLGDFFLKYMAGLQIVGKQFEKMLGPDSNAQMLMMHSVAQFTVFNSRSAYISVWSEPGSKGDLLGFARIFDGTDYSKLAAKPNSWKAYYSPEMPTEQSLRMRNVRTDYFDKLRAQGYHILDFSKYFLSENLKGEDRDYVRGIIHKFLQENFMNEQNLIFADRVVFVLHMGSNKLKEHYEQTFGAKDIPPDSIVQGKLKSEEHIMVVDMETLRQKLGF